VEHFKNTIDQNEYAFLLQSESIEKQKGMDFAARTPDNTSWKMAPILNVLAAIVFGDELDVNPNAKPSEQLPPFTSIEINDSIKTGVSSYNV